MNDDEGQRTGQQAAKRTLAPVLTSRSRSGHEYEMLHDNNRRGWSERLRPWRWGGEFVSKSIGLGKRLGGHDVVFDQNKHKNKNRNDISNCPVNTSMVLKDSGSLR